ncbi:protoporphyrinogen oxidase [Rhizohabitans arisaemae]|uniref:protoporphyrinogen oxidase n=1 Tax=Rhizohabitans arisaemae TaxID=2720610 RepID=UPI0024B14F65|nr:protoporphyrinogen oxidase [Rhizohabitans arisaemae]
MEDIGGSRRHVVVVGGGIAGLAAAWFLRRDGGDRVRVTVLEGAPRIGGKLSVSEVAGIAVDEGAEAMLVRRPEGEALAREAGLGPELVYPATLLARVWSRGALREFPHGHVLGVPGDLATLAASGVLSPTGLIRASMDQVLAPTLFTGDVSVAGYLGARLGREVVDRLVEPMLGGVYAGRTERLSLAATLPQIAAAARDRRSVLAAVREIRDGAPRDPGPVFTTVVGGLGTLPGAVAAASGATVRTGAVVRELRRTPSGWRLTVGPARAPETVEADAVIVAVPAAPAGRLLAAEVPAAAAELAGIEYASMAVVTLAYPREAFPEPLLGSGYLVPAVEDRAVKGVSFSSVKWPHLARSATAPVVVRCSLGRFGDERLLHRDDAELVALAVAELAETSGARGLPRDTRVTRWGGGLPQYEVGHLERIARIRAAEATQPGLALCGAAYDGIGIPAITATARAAAARVLDHLDPRREWRTERVLRVAG